MERTMHPMQALMDGMGAAWQRERATTQMTLGALIAALEAIPKDRLIVGLGRLMSYRGYYSDLAFEPETNVRAVDDVLRDCRAAMGRAYEGYKGGDFQMGERTPLWVARYGRCGPRLMSLDTTTDPIQIVTAEEDEVT